MPSTLAPAAAQPEPTLRDVLDAVNGLGTRMDRFEDRMDRFEDRMDGLETRIGGLETTIGGLETRIGGLETRIGGLETRIGGLEVRMTSVENGIRDLTFFVGEQFAHSTREIARLRAADEEHLVRFERIEAKVDEAVRLGRDNQRIALKNQEDIARIDRKLDVHLSDHEVHLPRPRSADVPEIGPMAA